ncbi:hypothetical protein TSUD_176240 [Trifolium subterraneum]|uniref:Uncharacterized protein n=1 Tax=Trifolium subterraneum TaxID=3900 RepID=A0A2Z6LKG4_TRISU|nr:hypothetical protein TSUD_176240 [Trifolium subterraneum]
MSSPRHLCGGGRPDSKETPTATMKLRFNLQEKQEQNMAGTEAKQRTLDLTKKLWVLREDICALYDGVGLWCYEGGVVMIDGVIVIKGCMVIDLGWFECACPHNMLAMLTGFPAAIDAASTLY